MDQQPDPTFGNADTSDTPQDFFERPVKIAEFNWEIGSTLFEQIQPWKLYFEEPRVANKMAHFRNLRCNLRLKFVLNGNPFYFGRVIASAQPLPHLDNITKFDIGVRADFVQASQRPHVYLNPTTCEGGELVLPFFFYKNTLDITRAEWRDMGIVTVASLNGLQHANNAPEPVTITVFAMAENVNVSTPTSVLFPGIEPQSAEVPIEPEGKMCVCTRCIRAALAVLSGDRACASTPRQDSPLSDDTFLRWVHQANEKTPPEDIIFEPQSGEEPADEYGVVSAPAHQVANLAGDLSNAPIIGPYARATQMIASGIAAMAQLFGFSRPRVVEEPCSYLPRHAGHLAVTNVRDNISSLAVDAKKEVTVDGRVVGLDGMDEMALVPIACRESYLTTFNWSTTDNPNQPLYSQRISPLMFNKEGDNFHLTPSAWTTLPFAYWKGSVELRFKIVCSEYHRGRIRIVWDPLYFSSDYSEVYNVNYTEVIDISETRDFSVRIGWGQQTSYLPTGTLSDMFDLTLPRTLYDSVNPFCNGAISVLVVNQLTTPASPQPIEINVYTKMCEDYEVAAPECLNMVNLQIEDFDPAFDESDPALGGEGGPGGPGPDPVPPPPDPDALPAETPAPPLVYEEGFPFTPDKVWFSGRDASPVRTGSSSAIPENFAGALSYSAALEFNPTFPGRPYTATVRLPTDPSVWPGGVPGTTPVTFVFDAIYFTPPYGLGRTVELDLYVAGVLIGEFRSTIGNIRSGFNDSITVDVPFSTNAAQVTITDPSGGSNIDHRRGRILLKKILYPWPPGWRAQTHVTSDYNGWFVIDDATSAILLPTNYDAGGRPYIEATTPFTIRGDERYTLASADVQFTMDMNDPGDAGNELLINGTDPILLRDPDVTTPQRDIPMYSETVDGLGGGVPVYQITSGVPITMRVYGFMFLTDVPTFPPLLPESGEEMMEGDDEANAPIKSGTEMYMAPVCDSGQINSVHFGERITSWRQMLKRYNDTLRLDSDSNTQVVLNDAVIDDPAADVLFTGFVPNPEMPLMRWVRSAYLAKRGSMRYKLMIHSRQNQVKSAYMSRVCQTDRVASNLDGLTNAQMSRVSHAGSNFANVSNTGVIDAEVPFYSNLRFHPSRVFANYDEDPDRGREFSWFRLDLFSNDSSNLIDVAMAAAEDLSFHFFLSAPIVSVKDPPP